VVDHASSVAARKTLQYDWDARQQRHQASGHWIAGHREYRFE
jgi:hypothetical protein